MKLNTFLSLFLIFSSPHVFAWTVKADFENGTIGETANGTDAFNGGAGTNSIYADTPALSGNQSVSLTAKDGDTGFGRWGGGWGFPTLREGDQIWYRVNVYYPTGWDFSCGGCTEGMKFMRIHTFAADGSNEGYQHLFIFGNGETGGLVNASSEISIPQHFFKNNPESVRFNIGAPILRENWHTFEMYLKISSVEGQGIYRVWQDGILIFEDLQTATIVSATSVVSGALLYTYWNNGAPKTQTSYADDIVITNEVPGRKDAQGNPYIGVGASIYIAPPKPPHHPQ